MTKQVHLSDGAVEAIRTDLAHNRVAARSQKVHISDEYVERALDEIAWLREREVKLQQALNNLVDHLGQLGADFRDLCLAVEAKSWDEARRIVDEKWHGND
jgi:hypothetical protein